MLLNTGLDPVPSKSGLLTTVGYKIGTQPAVYCLEGSIAITGALVQWLRDNLKMIEKSSDIETLARTVADNGGMYIVPAFSGLFAPYWRSDARGVMVGLTRYITSRAYRPCRPRIDCFPNLRSIGCNGIRFWSTPDSAQGRWRNGGK